MASLLDSVMAARYPRSASIWRLIGSGTASRAPASHPSPWRSSTGWTRSVIVRRCYRPPTPTGSGRSGGASTEPRVGHVGQARLLVHPLVVGDLAEDVGERLVAAVLGLERRAKRRRLPGRVLLHQLGVLVFGMVFEVGVEPVAQGWVDHVQEPGQLVIGERQHL